MTDQCSCKSEEPVGRMQAQYADDALCDTCNLWFRRGDLTVLDPKTMQVLTHDIKSIATPIWGWCPLCKGAVYATPSLK